MTSPAKISISVAGLAERAGSAVRATFDVAQPSAHAPSIATADTAVSR